MPITTVDVRFQEPEETTEPADRLSAPIERVDTFSAILKTKN